MAITTINPATGQLLRTFEPLSAADIEAKIRRAAEAFPQFRKLSFAQRAAMMKKAATILEAEKGISELSIFNLKREVERLKRELEGK